VKAFFGFQEDGTPLHASELGLEDVALQEADIMSYRGVRPVCAVCQLNLDSILLTEDGPTLLRQILWELEHEREKLWSTEV